MTLRSATVCGAVALLGLGAYMGGFSPFEAPNAAASYATLEDGQELSLDAFDKVKLSGPSDVYISVGGSQSVKVSGKDKFIKALEVEVEDGELQLKFKMSGSYSMKKDDLRIDITVPELKAATIKGSGDMRATGVKGTSFDAEVKGSGDLHVKDADIVTLSVAIAGSGDVFIDGKCTKGEYAIRGSGDIDADGMVCEDIVAKIQGSGDIAVYASKKALGQIKGSGDIQVYGNPEQLESDIRGSGDVHRK